MNIKRNWGKKLVDIFFGIEKWYCLDKKLALMKLEPHPQDSKRNGTHALILGLNITRHLLMIQTFEVFLRLIMTMKRLEYEIVSCLMHYISSLVIRTGGKEIATFKDEKKSWTHD